MVIIVVGRSGWKYIIIIIILESKLVFSLF